MGDFLSYFKSKKVLINLLVLGILVLALPLGIKLIREQQIIKSRATEQPPVKFIEGENTFQRNGQWMATRPQVTLELTSPLGPPEPAATATPTPGPTATPTPHAPTATPAPAATATPAPVTAQSATFNGVSFSNLDGAAISTKLTFPSGQFYVDVPVVVNLSSGSPRNLIIRFNYLGPCTGKAPGTCTFDSRAMYVNTDGSRTESITAYGKYWNFNSANNWAPMDGNSKDLTAESRYASGPCAGKSAGTCNFDSRAMYVNTDGSRTESITAYGKYWNFNSPSGGGWNPGAENGSDLTTVDRYKAGGPCAGKAVGTCTFDNQTVWYNSDGTRGMSVIIGGRYWNYTSPSGGIWNLTGEGDLATVPSYIVQWGPCKDKQTCTFDTQTVWYNAGDQKRYQAITIGGYYWNYTSPSGGVWDLIESGDLAGDKPQVAYYKVPGGPCAGKDPGTCRFDTQTVWYNSDGTRGQSITIGGYYWNYISPSEGIWNLTDSKGDLAGVSFYNAAGGPCAGKAAGTCTFDSHTVWYNAGDQTRSQSITIGGKFWNYTSPSGGVWNLTGSGDLANTFFYGGPCAGKSAGTCNFDSRAMYVNDAATGSRTESITAYGRYWNWNENLAQTDQNLRWELQPADNRDLTSVDRYAGGPCAGKSAGTCTFDSRAMYLESNSSKTESITAYGKFWNFNSANGWASVSGNGDDLTTVPRYGR